MTCLEAGMLIVGAVLAVLGVISLGKLPGVFFQARREDREAIRATGVVVELTEEPEMGSDGAGPSWHPVVRFEAEDGVERVFQARYGTMPSKWEVGDPIGVAYPPSRPEAARVDHPFMAYQPALVALIIGVVFLGFGTGLVLLALFHD